MDDTALTERIVERLAAGEDPKNIAFDLCSQTGGYYPDVEALVKRVQAENESRIVRKQSPLLVLIALVTFLGGLAMLAAGLYSIVGMIIFYNPGGDDPIGFTAFLLLLVQNVPQGLYLAGLGIIALLGSLAGMQKVWAAMLDGLFSKAK